MSRLKKKGEFCNEKSLVALAVFMLLAVILSGACKGAQLLVLRPERNPRF